MSSITHEKYEKVLHLFVEILKRKGYSDDDVSLRLTIPSEDNTINSPFPVDVRDSQIHGKGVFTIKDVNKGDVLTVYPCHHLGIVSNGQTIVKKLIEDGLDWNIKYAQCTYMTKDSIIYIGGNPNIHSSHFCGHLINDPFKHVEMLNNSLCDINEFGKMVLNYELQSLQLSNCKIYTSRHYAYVVAIKDMKKDTELLTPYGPMYWLNCKLDEFTMNMLTFINNQTYKHKKTVFSIHNKYLETFHNAYKSDTPIL